MDQRGQTQARNQIGPAPGRYRTLPTSSCRETIGRENTHSPPPITNNRVQKKTIPNPNPKTKNTKKNIYKIHFTLKNKQHRQNKNPKTPKTNTHKKKIKQKKNKKKKNKKRKNKKIKTRKKKKKSGHPGRVPRRAEILRQLVPGRLIERWALRRIGSGGTPVKQAWARPHTSCGASPWDQTRKL